MTQNQINHNELTYIPLDDNKNYYYSHDIGLVAFLLCKNHELVSLDKEIKSKAMFILKRRLETENEIKNYWDFKSNCDGQTFFNQLKRLKNQIYSPY